MINGAFLQAKPDTCPGQIAWHFDREELIADGIVHAIGVCLGLIGAVAIVVIALKLERIEVAPIFIYAICLVTMLVFSAAYNMWPVSPAKWVLRRYDHSAIYLLIAGTYTPFLAQMKNILASAGLGIGVWSSAFVGIALKLALPLRVAADDGGKLMSRQTYTVFDIMINSPPPIYSSRMGVFLSAGGLCDYDAARRPVALTWERRRKCNTGAAVQR